MIDLMYVSLYEPFQVYFSGPSCCGKTSRLLQTFSDHLPDADKIPIFRASVYQESLKGKEKIEAWCAIGNRENYQDGGT